MNLQLSRIALCLSVYIIFLYHQGKSHGQISQSEMEQKFQHALDLLTSFKNDSARSILCNLLEQFEQKQELESPFALKVRLRLAEALEKDNQDEEAIKKLLPLLEDGRKNRQWDVLSNAHLSLARLQEKLGREKSCKENLNSAKHIIRENKLANIYPRFAIRNASYHRIFGEKDSAIFFAEEVLRTAPLLGLKEDLAVGHLLRGLLSWKQSLSKTAFHLTKAGKIWKQIEDYSGYQAVMINLTRLNLSQGNPQEALRFNDSALFAAKLANLNGNEEKYRYFIPYKNRADIFDKLGLKDSAFHYLRLGYELELKELKQSNSQKIIEIDARYNYEKKAQELRENEQLLKYEKERQNWLIRLCVFAIFCFATITYYYLSLRKANKKTHEQAQEIEQANQDLSIALQHQIDLQGEVHHRVKNNLQVIIALMELQSEEIQDPMALNQLKAMSNRIYSMAAIHDLLYQKQGEEQISFKNYIENLCLHFGNFSNHSTPVKFFVDIEEQNFNLQTLMPLGIILNELITNSLKYAQIEGKNLAIDIKVEKQNNGETYRLRYKDNGPGLPQGHLVEREGGLGTYLLKSMCRQLNGSYLSKSENGAEFEVIFKEINKS